MNKKVEKLTIEGITYIPEDSITQEIVNFTGKESIASRMINKPVIVRSNNEGINVGIVVLADETGVELKNVRRLYYHKPKDKSLSWYEGVAESGISNDSKVSGTTSSKIIIENYSMTLIKSMDIYNQILNIVPNAQN